MKYYLIFWIAGILLILGAEELGLMFVKQPHGTNGWIANNNAAAKAGETLRWLGGALIIIGATERIACLLPKPSEP